MWESGQEVIAGQYRSGLRRGGCARIKTVNGGTYQGHKRRLMGCRGVLSERLGGRGEGCTECRNQARADNTESETHGVMTKKDIKTRSTC